MRDGLARLPRQYAQREVRYATVTTARLLTTPAFIKSANPTKKSFDSGVYPGGWAIPERRGFDDPTPVLIAAPVAWEVEYRCILLEGRDMTCAPYARAGRWVRARDRRWHAPEPELVEVTRLCRALAGDPGVQLPLAFTLEVGRTEDRGWAVVELNPVWSSGLYGQGFQGVIFAVLRGVSRSRHAHRFCRLYAAAAASSGHADVCDNVATWPSPRSPEATMPTP